MPFSSSVVTSSKAIADNGTELPHCTKTSSSSSLRGSSRKMHEVKLNVKEASIWQERIHRGRRHSSYALL
eukprot:scaffold364140_cov29-Prasinocladus_malaysianus.AAC.2